MRFHLILHPPYLPLRSSPLRDACPRHRRCGFPRLPRSRVAILPDSRNGCYVRCCNPSSFDTFFSSESLLADGCGWHTSAERFARYVRRTHAPSAASLSRGCSPRPRASVRGASKQEAMYHRGLITKKTPLCGHRVFSLFFPRSLHLRNLNLAAPPRARPVCTRRHGYLWQPAAEAAARADGDDNQSGEKGQHHPRAPRVAQEATEQPQRWHQHPHQHIHHQPSRLPPRECGRGLHDRYDFHLYEPQALSGAAGIGARGGGARQQRQRPRFPSPGRIAPR